MTLKPLIDAAMDGNAAEFETHFEESVKERLSIFLEETRRQVYMNALGIQESEDSDEETKDEDESEDEADDNEATVKKSSSAARESDASIKDLK